MFTQAPTHTVQLYDAEGKMLANSVVRYAAESLTSGGSVILVATPTHQETFLSKMESMGIEPETTIRESRLLFLNAAETLDRFMVDGYPDADRFERSVGAVVRAEAARIGSRHRLRVYGEMVGLLWEARQFPAALRLEQLWNRLQKAISFDLFCGYPINIFDTQFRGGTVDALLCAHTHVLPSGDNNALESAIDRAMQEVLGMNIRRIDAARYAADRRPGSPVMPNGEALILWLRNSSLKGTDEVLARAEKYYLASA
jgi:MEDS: MEthanogen/methylotroph, DcmR Sensory domain